MSVLERIVGLPYRIQFRLRNRGRQKLQTDTLALLRGLFEKSESLGLQNSRRIHNVALYALLLDQDLWQFNCDMVLATSDRRRSFVARHLTVLLYEGADDLPALLGKDYRESLRRINVPGDWMDGLNQISRGFNAFRNKRQAALSTIRNAVAAHRAHDVKKQLDLLDSLRPIEITKLAAQFSEPLNKLVRLQTKLTAHLGGLGVLLQDLVTKPHSPERTQKKRRGPRG